jgi:hypothetical protein
MTLASNASLDEKRAVWETTYSVSSPFTRHFAGSIMEI